MSEQPTRVRFAVVAVTTLMSVLLYLDRFCISFAEIFIKEDLGLTDVQIGWMMSAFFWTYALGQVPSGWLSDRFGARIMLTTYILVWSAFTAWTGWASGFLVLMLLRFGFGLGQAGAYPTSASVISKWMPFTARGKASSTVAMGGRMGGAFAPVLTAYLIVLFVPVGESQPFGPDDLLDAGRLSYEMVDGQQAQARVGEWFLDPGNEASDALRSMAAEYGQRLQELRSRAEAEGEDPEDVYVPAGTVGSPQQRQVVAAAVRDALESPDFFDEARFQDVPREAEARRLLEQSARTSLETRRLNRLMLEGVYPDSVRKVYGQGWRPVMKVYGLLGLIVAAAFWLVHRNRPSVHPWVNEAEQKYIDSGRPASAQNPHGKVDRVPLKELVTSRSMWLVCLTQWCTNVGWIFLVTWLPRYLLSKGVSIEQRGWMTFVPTAVGWFGMMYGGVLTDRLVRSVGLRWGRSLPISISRFTAMGAYLFCVLLDPSPWVAVAAFAVVAFSTDLGTGAIWAFKQDVGGRYVGSILGWGNMWGNLGAAVTPPLLIWIVGENTQNWDAAFLTCAAAFFIAGVAALGVDATIPIAPPDEESGEGIGETSKPEEDDNDLKAPPEKDDLK